MTILLALYPVSKKCLLETSKFSTPTCARSEYTMELGCDNMPVRNFATKTNSSLGPRIFLQKHWRRSLLLDFAKGKAGCRPVCLVDERGQQAADQVPLQSSATNWIMCSLLALACVPDNTQAMAALAISINYALAYTLPRKYLMSPSTLGTSASKLRANQMKISQVFYFIYFLLWCPGQSPSKSIRNRTILIISLHLFQDIQEIDFQTNDRVIQFHGDKCAEDINLLSVKIALFCCSVRVISSRFHKWYSDPLQSSSILRQRNFHKSKITNVVSAQNQ